MAYEPRLIAPFENSGLKKWFKPWLIGQNAFPIISNAYARRGVVRKREGMRLLATIPTSPVQGIKNWINNATLNERLIVFSRTKSYLFDDTTQTFNDVTFDAGGNPFSFSNGTNDYFWTSNYASSMWTVNGVGTAGQTDHIKYWNVTNNWSTIQPIVNGVVTLDAALIILPYKGRLVVLNTFENNINFQSRARWSQIGTPYTLNTATSKPAPGFSIDVDAWRDDIPGKGGFIDADTSERIVSAAIIRDVLVVFFQRSTWRLTYTGNEILPFIWERLNTQYGSESPYSVVPFDDAALTFSRYGWIASSTNEVARIDLDIPDDSFSIDGLDTSMAGLNKVQGIRDFYRNFAYFTFLTEGAENANQIYAYNYIDKSWTIFNPTVPINVFGYYRNTVGDLTWGTFTAPDDTWGNFNTVDDVWSAFGSGQNIDFPYILGGDLHGNVNLMFEFYQAPTTDYNGSSQVNFNFSIYTKRLNPYFDKGLKCRLGYVDLYCTAMPGGEITVYHYVDDQQTPVLTKTVELFSRGVINITNISTGTSTTITTSADNGLENGEFVTISDIVGSVGQFLNNKTFKVASATTTTFIITDANGNNINTTGTSYTQAGFVYNADLPQGDAKYTRIYLGAIAHMHQLQFTLSDNQLNDPVKGAAQFEMQGLVTWTKPAGRIRG